MATKQKSANSEEPRVDVQSEVKGKVDERRKRESNAEGEANLIPSETMDDDECRKDSFYDTEADNDTASVQLCFIIVIVGWLAAL
jgi:hypothetical protein